MARTLSKRGAKSKPDLSAAEARRIALAAQGFADPKPSGRVDARHLRRVLSRIGLVQIDSVNAVARAHYFPFFSRLGPYPMPLLDDLAYRRRELFETWAHEASLVPIEREPLFRHRMAAWPQRRARRAEWLAEHAEYLEGVLEEVRARGPLLASDLGEPTERRGPWWDWGRGKLALESHFGMGTVAVSGRRNFARLYDVRERVLPPSVLEHPTPEEDEAVRGLVLLSAQHHGVGTVRDLADYYRLGLRPTGRALEALADEGLVRRVTVEGWEEPAYLDVGARVPRKVEARALLAPFDPVVWERARAQRLFDFDYRIEIYTPAPQRRFGYYVLPFVLGDRIVGRVDVRAERARGVLSVPASHLEGHAEASEVAGPLAEELGLLAEWLGLERLEVGPKGDLAAALRRAVR
ncbi:MAG: crosslink repair DNA glycosylase YcaQ family protein [Dehalococcoidia bacterium]